MATAINNYTDYQKQIDKAIEKLLNACSQKFATKEDLDIIQKAIDIATHAHRTQYRKSGEPFILHPIAVAQILVDEIGLRKTTIVSALLHDTVEDNPEEYSIEYIKEIFGEDVSKIVDGVTKITQVSENDETTQTASIKKLLKNIQIEPRTIFVKIADRLHNLRTLDSMPQNKKIIKAAETHYFYAPLAHSFGLTKIRNEMEDLSFQHHNAEEYYKLKQIINKKNKKRNEIFHNFNEKITKVLKENGIKHRFVPVKKSYYKTWSVMQKRGISFNEVHNYLTVRVVFDNAHVLKERSSAFIIFSHITDLFELQENSFHDYLKSPKENGFSALVFNVMGDRGKWVEIQIMSERMNQIAEQGFYSSGFQSNQDKSSPQIKWLEQIHLQLNSPEHDAFSFMENFQEAFVRSKINVYTPKGEIVRLPKDATVLDFAFHIHSDIALACRGANVNGKTQGLDFVLKNADQVKILTSEFQKPDEIWLDFVISTKSKNGIKYYFKKEKRKNIENGIIIFQELLSEFGIKQNEQLMLNLRTIFEYKSNDELFCKLSRGHLTKEQVHQAIKQTIPSFKFLNISIPKLWFTPKTDASKQLKSDDSFNNKKPFVIEERSTVSYQIAKCCNPIPGDNCIAYKNEHGTIFVHEANCQNAIQYLASNKSYVTNVQWGQHKFKSFPAKINIKGSDRKGMMVDITSIISSTLSINMKTVFFTTTSGVFTGEIDLYVTNIKVLDELILQLRKIPDIEYVNRIKS